MTTHTIPIKSYIEASQLFHWATKEHYAMWFTGSSGRHRRTEAILPRLVKARSIFATDYSKRLVYTCPRRVRNPDHILKIEHGLGVTEGLVRFWWSNMNGEIIQERYFYGLGCVPEWGLRYPSGKMLLYEFSTENDFGYSNKIKNKLAAYRNHIKEIEEKFRSSAIIVFVIDVPRIKIERFVREIMPAALPVYFVDYESFKKVPLMHQFSEPIYIFGEDGKVESLKDGH